MSDALFTGLRILGFTWVGVGPFATKFFSDHGAEVIKVESMRRADTLRTMHPAVDRKPGLNRGGYFANRNSGKLSLGVDVSSPQGLELVKRLVPVSDVVVSNFRPGVMDKLGMGYEAVRALRPDIVYVAMPMFGEDGPYRDYAGYGLILGAMAGLTALTRYADGPPQGTGTNFCDHVPNPIHGALAISAALLHRARTGLGQFVEISQLESSVNFIGPALLQAAVTGTEPAPGDSGSPNAPEGVFRCRGDDAWCAISCDSDDAWLALCEVLSLPPASRTPELRDAAGRRAARDQIEGWIAERLAGQDRRQIAAALSARGICAAAVNDAGEAIDDPHLNARGHWARLPRMTGDGEMLYNAPPMHFDGQATPHSLTRAPRLGEHTRLVCGKLLNMEDSAIDEYFDRGILFES